VKTLLLLSLAMLFATPAAAGSSAMDSATPATLTVRDSAYGRIIFDGRGRALYAFTRDTRGGRTSTCYGTCATAWPVYYAGTTLSGGVGINRSLIGTIKRTNGKRQVTYNGWPLYYYVGDTRTGQVSCQNIREFGGLWLVVRPSGKLVR
jgi:predicted lipoprotein with Yx(FWY)xxD motif